MDSRNSFTCTYPCLRIVGTVSHVLIRAYVAQEKETCALVLVGCFWLFNLENRSVMLHA